MESSLQLVRRLADGRFHSGAELARESGISRVAVWKRIQGLRDRYGLAIHAVRGRGYQLAAPLELLDLEVIRSGLTSEARRRLGRWTLHDSVDSTNSWLMRRIREDAPPGWVCISEHQTQGRGRHGRQWISPFGSSVYFSLLWCFSLPPIALQGLSLAVGVALRRALCEQGLEGVTVKWPNDIELDGGKLAGVLIEMSGEAGGRCDVVIGIGVNVFLSPEAAAGIDRPWADLTQHSNTCHVSRNGLVAAIANHMVSVLQQFGEMRFEPFIEEWRAADAWFGKQVVLVAGEQRVEGQHNGIDRDGALLLNTGGRIRRFVAGEMSLRSPA